jgi:hypothetical protein
LKCHCEPPKACAKESPFKKIILISGQTSLIWDCFDYRASIAQHSARDAIKVSRDDIAVIPAILLFGSLAILVTMITSDCRPITLRHQVSLILPFGQPVNRDQHLVLILDAWLCVAVFWRFCFYRQSGGHGHVIRVTLDP